MDEKIINALAILSEALDRKTIDVDLIISIVNLKRKIENINNPIFTINNISVMENYDKFEYTGLSKTDYIMTGYYKIEDCETL